MQDTQWSTEVVAKSWRRPLHVTLGLATIGRADSQLLRAALAMRILLLADIVSEPSAGVVRDYMRTINGLRTIDVGQYASDWSTLKEWLTSHADEYHRLGPVGCLSEFKPRLRRQIHYKWIWNTVEGLLREGADFSKMLQWIVFDEKINFPTLDLTEVYERDYVETEDAIAKYCYALSPDLRQIASEVLQDFSVQLYPFRPGHGPGATLEMSRSQANAYNKNTHLRYGPDISNYLWRRYASEDGDDAWWFLDQEGDTVRSAKLVCVPKSMTKNRTISKEPTTLQYLQQDLFRAVEDWISSHPMLRWHIDLRDQEASRSMALRGSRDGCLSTIDLSKASDLVTLPLLREMAGQSMLLDAVESTRSMTCILPSGREIPILKVAGMGNAICFPLECVVFAICCECACRRAGMVDTRYSYRVFGDDIIIDTRAVTHLFNILDECHFVVNTEKSFYSDHGPCFREACGIWSYGGVDITPLRLSRRLALHSYKDDQSITITDPQTAGWIALTNEALRHGFYRLNRGLHAFLRDFSWYNHIYRVGYVAERERTAWSLPSPYFLTLDACATQWNADRRWNSSLQRTEVRCLCYSARARRSPQDDNDLLSWWTIVAREADPEKRDPSDWTPTIGADFRANRELSGTAGTTPLKLGWKWVEA